MDDPTPERVLAAKRPSHLFGEDALRDPQALKRAYARLIRAFKPDDQPDVFAHIRRLYEQARHRPFPPDPVRSPPSERSPEDLPSAAPDIGDDPEAPAHALARHLSRGAWDLVDRLITTEAGYLRSTDPHLWLEAMWAVTEARLFETPTAVLQQRLGALDTLDPSEHLAAIIGIEELVLLGLSVAEARNDPRVPRPLIEAIADAWAIDEVAAARRWREAAREIGDSSTLAEDLLYLQHQYPVVHRAYAQVAARLSGSEPVHRSWLEGWSPPGRRLRQGRIVRALSRSFFSESWFQNRSSWAARLLGVSTIVVALFAIRLTLRAGWVPTLAVLVVLGLLVTGVRTAVRQRRDDADQWTPALRTEALTALRTHTLWPHELTASVMSHRVQSNHALPTQVRFEQDASLTLAAMTDAHVRRIEHREPDDEDERASEHAA